MPDRKMLRMGQLRHRPLFPAHVSRVTNSKFGKDSVTALNGQRTALNDCKLPSIFEQMPSVRSKMFQGSPLQCLSWATAVAGKIRTVEC